MNRAIQRERANASRATATAIAAQHSSANWSTAAHFAVSRLWLFHSQHAVHAQLLQRLLAPAGPVNNQLVDRGCRAQAEVQPLVVLRKITRAGHALRRLPLARREDFNPRADAVAIALRSFRACT